MAAARGRRRREYDFFKYEISPVLSLVWQELTFYVRTNRTGRGKRIIVNRSTVTSTFFCTYSYIFVRKHFRCYPKEARAVIGENFSSVRDTGSASYRVYGKTYARTTVASKKARTKICTYGLWSRVPKNTVAVNHRQ